MAILNELVTKFSFVGSLKKQESFNSNLKSSIGLLAGMGTAIVGAAAGFAAWTSSVTEAIDPMVQLSRETGTSISAIQELGFAASQNGSSLEAVQSSIKEVTKRAGEFARTGGGPASEAFLQLGISVRDTNGDMKTADTIMTDLSGTLQGFSKGEQADILDKLGIDPSMIQLLDQSSDSVDDLRSKARALGTVTKEQADAAASLNDANTVLQFGLTGLKNSIAVGVAPVIQDITDGFIEFLMANKDLIANGVKKLGVAIIAVSGFIKRMAPVVIGVAAAFGVWTLATGGMATVMGVLLSPVVLITTALIATALAVDDLIVAFNGGNSVIADFIKQLTGFDIVPMLQNSVAAVKDFGIELANIFSGIWDSMLSGFMDAFAFISDSINSVGSFFGDDEKPTGFRGGNSGAVDRGVINNSSSNANVTQSNNINVYSSDPLAAGRAVADQNSNSLRETRQYFSRGGI